MLRSSRKLWSLCSAGMVLCVLLIPSMGWRQKAQPLAEPPELRIYALRHASANQVSDVLQTLITDKEMRLSVDDRTNRLIVFGKSTVHQSVAELIQTLDARNEGPTLSVVRSADKALAISQILNQLDLEVHVAMDPDLGTIILKGSKEAVEHARELIEQLERVVPGRTADREERQYSVELFTVTSGEADDPAALRRFEADDLGGVSAALQKKGIDHPTLLAKSEITALAHSAFSASDATFAQVTGTAEPASTGVRLEIEITMAGDDRPVSFQTTILTKLNHPIAIASTQTSSSEAKTYVMIVRVREN